MINALDLSRVIVAGEHICECKRSTNRHVNMSLDDDAKKLVRLIRAFASHGLHISPSRVCSIDQLRGEVEQFDVRRVHQLKNEVKFCFTKTSRYDDFQSNSRSLSIDMILARQVMYDCDDPYVSHGETIVALILAGFYHRFVANAPHCLIRCSLHPRVRVRADRPEDFIDDDDEFDDCIE